VIDRGEAPRRPRLIVVSGLPGAGKSTLADGLGTALRAPAFSVDPIEGAIAAAGIVRSFETGLAAYLVVEEVANAVLARGLDVIVDAVSGVEPARDMWRGLAARWAASLRVIVCEADPAITGARLSRRDRGSRLGEPSEADVEARRAEWTAWTEPHLRVDAASPATANLAAALAWLAAPDPIGPLAE
jgi:predicted kinase